MSDFLEHGLSIRLRFRKVGTEWIGCAQLEIPPTAGQAPQIIKFAAKADEAALMSLYNLMPDEARDVARQSVASHVLAKAAEVAPSLANSSQAISAAGGPGEIPMHPNTHHFYNALVSGNKAAKKRADELVLRARMGDPRAAIGLRALREHHARVSCGECGPEFIQGTGFVGPIPQQYTAPVRMGGIGDCIPGGSGPAGCGKHWCRRCKPYVVFGAMGRHLDPATTQQVLTLMEWAIHSIPIEFTAAKGGSVISKAATSARAIMADPTISSTPIIRTRPAPTPVSQLALKGATTSARSLLATPTVTLRQF